MSGLTNHRKILVKACGPFKVAKFVAHYSRLQFGSLNHVQDSTINPMPTSKTLSPENRNTGYWHIVDEILARHEGDPRGQLRALIAYVADRATTRGYRGCPFINYAAEFPERAHLGHRAVDANKAEMRRRLASLASAINARRPAQLADALFLLIEGAYASSQTLGGRNGPAKILPQAAEGLIESHLNR